MGKLFKANCVTHKNNLFVLEVVVMEFGGSVNSMTAELSLLVRTRHIKTVHCA